MAGTIPLSLTQQFDNTTGEILAGGLVYFIQAGTTATPQNAYQDSGLTLAYSNPYELSEDGRIPQLFFADGNIKIRITNAAGITQFSQDNLLVIGASSGGGGGATVDATTVLSTGDMKLVYNTGTLSGFVRANGRTIGNGSSGATERANADTSALFSFLWTADSNLSVSGGRGGSASADFAANKTIVLPDLRGRSPVGLDGMGSTAAGRLTAAYFGTSADTLGAAGGSESTTLTLAQLPTGITSDNASQSISVSVTSGRGVPSTAGNVLPLNPAGGSSGGGAFAATDGGGDWTRLTSFSGNNSIAVTSNNTSGAAHRTVQPSILVTIYIKL